ncbi:hypothetical protein A2U01_0004872, partial [Trifolium medium]|nr:hypothetical protein [Trifolium medium]
MMIFRQPVKIEFPGEQDILSGMEECGDIIKSIIDVPEDLQKHFKFIIIRVSCKGVKAYHLFARTNFVRQQSNWNNSSVCVELSRGVEFGNESVNKTNSSVCETIHDVSNNGLPVAGHLADSAAAIDEASEFVLGCLYPLAEFTTSGSGVINLDSYEISDDIPISVVLPISVPNTSSAAKRNLVLAF